VGAVHPYWSMIDIVDYDILSGICGSDRKKARIHSPLCKLPFPMNWYPPRLWPLLYSTTGDSVIGPVCRFIRFAVVKSV
jgi:hypothetical protein